MSTLIRKHKYHKRGKTHYYTMILKDGFTIQETGSNYEEAKNKGYRKFKFALAYFKNHQQARTDFIKKLYEALKHECDDVRLHGDSIITIDKEDMIYLLDEYVLSVNGQLVQLIDLNVNEALNKIWSII